MEYATIHISGNQATSEGLLPITAGTVGGRVALCFDETWEGFQKTLVWQGSGQTVTDTACTGVIPHEVLTRPYSPLALGVYGTKDMAVTPTVWASLGTIQPGADPSGDESAQPSLPIWAQLLQRMEALEADMTRCVKNTDYATNGSVGVVKILGVDSGKYGIRRANQIVHPGSVALERASDAEIKARSQAYKPIVPESLDYAVKTALTDNHLSLTEKEKTAVRTWLGL